MDEVLGALDVTNCNTALAIARIPEQIKGFGHVKQRHLDAARLTWAELMSRFRNPQADQKLA